MAKRKQGILIGRMSPMHLGHRRLIEKMVEECSYKNCMMLIGSCNAKQSMKHFFSYPERRGFIKKIFPKLRVMGLPDFKDCNGAWLLNLDDVLVNCGFDPKHVKFYTGNEEDIEVILGDNRDFTSVDRFDSKRPIISGERVRAALIHDKSREELIHLVGEDLVDDILTVFQKSWPEFAKR